MQTLRSSSSIKLDSGGGKPSAPWVMLEEVGMRPAEVAAVVTAYPLLLTVPAKHARTVVRWLAGRAGLSAKQVRWQEPARPHVSVCAFPARAHSCNSKPLGCRRGPSGNNAPVCLTHVRTVRVDGKCVYRQVHSNICWHHVRHFFALGISAFRLLHVRGTRLPARLPGCLRDCLAPAPASFCRHSCRW